jgi:microcystin-dependent protein
MLDFQTGTIVKFPHDLPIKGWMPCHGQSLQIQFYAALFTLIQSKYGSDSALTFKLPDLRQKKEDGSYYRVGEIMKDGTPYMDSFICVDGFFPDIIN